MFYSIDFVIVLVTILLAIFVGFIPKFSLYYRSISNRFNSRKRNNGASQDDHEDLEYYYYYYASSEADLHKNELIKGPSNRSAKRLSQVKASLANKRKPNFFLNAISLVVGFQSVLHVVGLPVEFYYHGFQSFQYMLSFIVAPVIISIFLVPFIYKLKSKSINEYLDDKFDGHKSVKVMALVIVLIFQFLFSALVLFSASITIMQTLASNYPGLSLWAIVAVLTALSALLAMLGLQSVIWSNLLQYLIMIGCNVTFIFLGIKYYNGYNGSASFNEGLRTMWNTTVESGRGDLFQFNENLRHRYTFLNGLIGVTFNVLPTYSFTQQSYMRIKQAKSVTSARFLLIAMIPFGLLNLTLIYFLGFVMFGYFYKCGDPFSSGSIKNQNQILAKFLTQFFDKYNGLLGLYIALLISNAIGSLSNAFKALSITLTEDILLRFKFFNTTSASNKNGVGKNASSSSNPAEAQTAYYKIRSFSFDRENMIESYQEERLALGYASKQKQRRIIKKFQRKDERFKRRLNVSIMVICSVLVGVAAILIEKAPGSLTQTTFSLLNSTHGPLLFIYLCARFNEFSIKRTRYVHNTSTKSKWKYFRLKHTDVVISCVLSMAVVLCLFVGKLATYSEASDFYDIDKRPVNVVSNRTAELQEFCAYEDKIPTTSLTDTSTKPVSDISFVNYLFAISFNWYPFIGFSVCFLTCLLLSTTALVFSFISKKCFKRMTTSV